MADISRIHKVQLGAGRAGTSSRGGGGGGGGEPLVLDRSGSAVP